MPRPDLTVLAIPAFVGAMAAEEWTLAATVFLSGLASGLLGMLSTIMRPMLSAMEGREFRE